MKRLQAKEKWRALEKDAGVMSIHVENDGSLFCTGLSTGVVSVRSQTTGRLSFHLTHSKGAFPVTSAKFHPRESGILNSISSDGSIVQWQLRGQREAWRCVEEGNELLTIDYNPSGNCFATAGSDAIIRIYDETKKSVTLELKRSLIAPNSPFGHSTKIFALHFDQTQPNLLFSAGWDTCVQIWDIRSNAGVGIFAWDIYLWGKYRFAPELCLDRKLSHA